MTAIESYGVRSQAAEKLALANMRLWSFTISKSSNILLKCDFFGEADENSLGKKFSSGGKNLTFSLTLSLSPPPSSS